MNLLLYYPCCCCCNGGFGDGRSRAGGDGVSLLLEPLLLMVADVAVRIAVGVAAML